MTRKRPSRDAGPLRNGSGSAEPASNWVAEDQTNSDWLRKRLYDQAGLTHSSRFDHQDEEVDLARYARARSRARHRAKALAAPIRGTRRVAANRARRKPTLLALLGRHERVLTRLAHFVTVAMLLFRGTVEHFRLLFRS